MSSPFLSALASFPGYLKKCRKAGLLANLYQADDGLSLVRSNIINPIKNGRETGRYFTKMIRRRIKTRGKGALPLARF